jgi:ClpP class serine protease
MSALHGLKGDKLDLILHSPGGSMEAADQIVQYLRSKYDYIRAIIPQNAMSAATMIACACDEIVMGKHSALGPIDPQVTFPTPSGSFTAPAQAILDEFEQAKKEVTSDPSTAPLWVSKVQAYPHGFLNVCPPWIYHVRKLPNG